ncbi:hypothetical protein K1719_007959 [Acacia pycnantha]|nr:hypothetical protein K1719_007959 [Acacia pycnantha]
MGSSATTGRAQFSKLQASLCPFSEMEGERSTLAKWLLSACFSLVSSVLFLPRHCPIVLLISEWYIARR